MVQVELIKVGYLKEAIQTLKDVLLEYSKRSSDGIRDGIIHRFEFTYELTWKTLKEHIEFLGREVRNNPKDVFRVAADNDIIQDPQIWFAFLRNRNMSSHLYSSEEMQKVFSDIPQFVVETEKVIVGIEKDLQA